MEHTNTGSKLYSYCKKWLIVIEKANKTLTSCEVSTLVLET